MGLHARCLLIYTLYIRLQADSHACAHIHGHRGAQVHDVINPLQSLYYSAIKPGKTLLLNVPELVPFFLLTIAITSV